MHNSNFEEAVQPNAASAVIAESINYEAQDFLAEERSKYCLYGSKKKQVQVSRKRGVPAGKQLTLLEHLVDRS